MELFREILKVNKKYNLIEDEDRVVVGFSGGPDSVFLIEMLKKLQTYINFRIYLVHINHLLRGDDADADEKFSYDYAKENNFDIFVKKIPIKEIAKKNGKTLEEVGREERYKFFNEIYNKVGGTKIATAHNKDDQIETFLFRMIRGSSLKGLEGIQTKKNNLIRPISEIYKKDIIEYLNKNKIQYKIDKTNFENEFTRNSIRLDLIPFIENRYNTKFKEKIFSLMKEIRDNNEKNSFDILNYLDENKNISLDKLKNLRAFDIKNTITTFLNEKNIKISRNKIEDICSLIKKNGTKKIDLDNGYRLVKDYVSLYIEDKNKAQGEYQDGISFSVPNEIIFNNLKIKASIVENELKNWKGENNFLLSISNGENIEVRYRRDGDKIFLSEEHSKKIKEIFINQKIPKDMRDKIPIFLYKDKIFWAYGVKKGYIPNSKENRSKLTQILLTIEEV